MTHPIHSADTERAAFEAAMIAYWQELHNEPLSENTKEFLIRRRASGEYFQFEREWQGWNLPRAAAQVGAKGAGFSESKLSELVTAAGNASFDCGMHNSDNDDDSDAPSYEELARIAAERREALIKYACSHIAAGAPAETKASKQAALQELVDQAQELDMGYGAPTETPTNEDFETLAESHVGHYADFAADVLERWGGWPHGVLGYGGSGNIAITSVASGAPAETQCKWPNCLPEHEQQALAAQVLGEVYSGAPAETPNSAHGLNMLIAEAAYRAGSGGGAVRSDVLREIIDSVINATPAATIGAGEGKDALDAARYRKIKADNDDCEAETLCLFFDSKSGGLISIESKDMDAEIDAAMRSKTSPGEAG